MDKTIGFIGCGNMAEAMIEGVIKSKLVSNNSIIASNRTEDKINKIKKTLSINVTTDNIEVAKRSDIIIIAVKPDKYKYVLEEIKGHIKKQSIIVTIAPGISICYVESFFNRKVKVVRTMPNTPALVGEGMTAICSNSEVTDEEFIDIKSIFKSFGKIEVIEEKLMDVVPSISGSSPAYVYLFIEALADGAVLRGISRESAYKMAAQSVLGASKMVLETKEHPAFLKDKVCSPGGTTIEAIYALEKNNFRGTVIEAMESCTKKAIEMSKGKKSYENTGENNK